MTTPSQMKELAAGCFTPEGKSRLAMAIHDDMKEGMLRNYAEYCWKVGLSFPPPWRLSIGLGVYVDGRLDNP